jgi:hypothetical protein
MELTHDIYGQRKLDLARAIELAEGEFHSAAFELQTGSGSADETGKAKAHLDKLRSDLEVLEGAWIAAQNASAHDWRDSRKAAFDAYLASVDELLTTRRAAVLEAQAAAVKLADAVKRYTEATTAIRQNLAPFHRNVSSTAFSNALLAVHMAIDPAIMSAAIAAGAILGDKGVSVPTHLRTNEAFNGQDAIAVEDSTAQRIRSALAGFAPKV